MKHIKTNKGETIKVDGKHHDVLSDHIWYINNGYAVTTEVLMSRKESRKTGKNRLASIKMHRMVYELENDVELESHEHIDHINRDRLDNRVSNLRLSPEGTSINQINVSIRSDNTTGYKGVTFREKTNKYEAKISYRGKRIWIGSFEDAESAALAYNSKAKDLFDNHCYLNKV